MDLNTDRRNDVLVMLRFYTNLKSMTKSPLLLKFAYLWKIEIYESEHVDMKKATQPLGNREEGVSYVGSLLCVTHAEDPPHTCKKCKEIPPLDRVLSQGK